MVIDEEVDEVAVKTQVGGDLQSNQLFVDVDEERVLIEGTLQLVLFNEVLLQNVAVLFAGKFTQIRLDLREVHLTRSVETLEILEHFGRLETEEARTLHQDFNH